MSRSRHSGQTLAEGAAVEGFRPVGAGPGGDCSDSVPEDHERRPPSLLRESGRHSARRAPHGTGPPRCPLRSASRRDGRRFSFSWHGLSTRGRSARGGGERGWRGRGSESRRSRLNVCSIRKPLDDETRMKRSAFLGRRCATSGWTTSDPLEPYDAGALDLYVDRELLDDLSARSRSPVSQAMQLQLAYRTSSRPSSHASAARGSDLKCRTWTDLGDSLLAKVLRIAAKAGPTHEQLLREVTADPAKVIAHAEAALDVLVRTREAVRDGES